MKKITAFFMALFPFLVIGILFVTGLVSKNFTDKTVQRLEMIKENISYQKTTDNDEEYPVALNNNVNIIPSAAHDPTIYWTSGDTSIATVEKETGKVTCKSWGDVKLNVVAKTNISAKAQCTLKIWDDKIHKIIVKNQEQAKFITPGSQLVLETEVLPSEGIKDKSLKFEFSGEHSGITVSPTGIITVDATANIGTYPLTISSVAFPNVKTTVNVSVSSDGLSTIGFDDPGNKVIQETKYNLYDHLITAPLDKSKVSPKYFIFESSDPTNAPIDENGVIEFKQDYIATTPVTFSVHVVGFPLVSATKTISSSLEYYSNVSFDRYSYTEQIASFNEPTELKDIRISTYPSTGKGLTITSSDDSVVKYQKGKFYALKPGKATLTVSGPLTEKSSIVDKVEVTILGTTSSILTEHTIDLGSEHYYALRKNLNVLFQNRNIKWSIPANDVAVLEDDIIWFKKPGTVKVTATDVETGKVDVPLTLTCSQEETSEIDVTSASATLNVGDKVCFIKEGQKLVVTSDYLLEAGEGYYIAKKGTQGTQTITIAGVEFTLGIIEPLIGFKTANKADWTQYTTNAKEVDIAKNLVLYPSTATIYSLISGLYKPEITYEYDPEDESAVTISENKIKFEKTTNVKITASCESVTKEFNVKSYAGNNGKFSMIDDKSSILQSGQTISTAPGVTTNLYIAPENLYLSDAGSLESITGQFSITSLSKGVITKIDKAEPIVENNKLKFSFTSLASGSDTIYISNGSFTFVVYLYVTKAITNIDLYCLGSKLDKENPINVYENNGLVLSMDFEPLVMAKTNVKVKFNDFEWKCLIGRQIDLTPSNHIKWLDGNNTLTISTIDTNKVLASYTLVNKTSTVPTEFIVDQAVKEDSKNMIYLTADSRYLVLNLDLKEGLCSFNYFKNHFSITGGLTSTPDNFYGKYVVLPIDAPNGEIYTKDINISLGSSSIAHTVKRDIVSKIVLPKHNNLDESDKKGLQRATVYGNKTMYEGKTETNVYQLPIQVFDYTGKEITDLATKNKAVSSLRTEFNINKEKKDGSATYNTTTGNFDIIFNNNYIYSFEDIFNNKFVDDYLTNKTNQLFSICTDYGKYHKDEPSYAWYSFVVVDAYNVYDQESIQKLDVVAGQTDEKAKIVLQTNFGPNESKEVKMFNLTHFWFNEVYGNGYSICFESIAQLKLASNDNIRLIKSINANLIGCLDETLPTLTGYELMFVPITDSFYKSKGYFAYNKINNFRNGVQIFKTGTPQCECYVKNSLFFNENDLCLISLWCSGECLTTTIEDCVFFHSSKIAIHAAKGATVKFKGQIYCYNFHGSDMFDALPQVPEILRETIWQLSLAKLQAANVIQQTEYGSMNPVTNSYLAILLDPTIMFYDHTDPKTGEDVYIEAQHGSEKAANYLKFAAGFDYLGMHLLDLWATVKPPLETLKLLDHSPAFGDEFLNGGESLNYHTRNILIELITRY